jgi:hypothetical protein
VAYRGEGLVPVDEEDGEARDEQQSATITRR